MTEFGYEDDKLNSCCYDESHKIELLKILSDFVNYNYINECQAGYIIGMVNCQVDGPVVVEQERIYKQLILFIHNQIDKEV